MSFLNEFTKKTTEATAKITREAKLKIKINEDKAKIKELYEKIGKKVYENHIRDDSVDIEEFIKENCINLDELSKSIEESRKEILILNNKKMCSNCFTEIEKDFKFCNECGEKQAE